MLVSWPCGRRGRRGDCYFLHSVILLLSSNVPNKPTERSHYLRELTCFGGGSLPVDAGDDFARQTNVKQRHEVNHCETERHQPPRVFRRLTLSTPIEFQWRKGDGHAGKGGHNPKHRRSHSSNPLAVEFYRDLVVHSIGPFSRGANSVLVDAVSIRIDNARTPIARQRTPTGRHSTPADMGLQAVRRFPSEHTILSVKASHDRYGTLTGFRRRVQTAYPGRRCACPGLSYATLSASNKFARIVRRRGERKHSVSYQPEAQARAGRNASESNRKCERGQAVLLPSLALRVGIGPRTVRRCA